MAAAPAAAAVERSGLCFHSDRDPNLTNCPKLASFAQFLQLFVCVHVWNAFARRRAHLARLGPSWPAPSLLSLSARSAERVGLVGLVGLAGLVVLVVLVGLVGVFARSITCSAVSRMNYVTIRQRIQVREMDCRGLCGGLSFEEKRAK